MGSASAVAATSRPRRVPGALAWLACAICLAGWPLLARREFYLHLAILVLIQAIGAISLNLLMRAGLLSFAHAAFMAVGAYASALTTMRAQWPYPLAFLAAGLAPGLIAVGIGPILLRLKGVYFVLVTFAFGEIVRLILVNWIGLTGGSNGIYGVPPAALPLPGGAVVLGSKLASYYLALAVAALAAAFVARLCASEMGRALETISEDELLAECLGVHTVRYKVLAFVTGAVLVGFAGSLYAHYVRYISPGDFTWRLSLDFIAINVVGGIRSIAGPLLSTVFIVSLPEVLRRTVEYQWILYSLALILVLAFLPEGIAGLPRRLRGRRAREGARLAGPGVAGAAAPPPD